MHLHRESMGTETVAGTADSWEVLYNFIPMRGVDVGRWHAYPDRLELKKGEQKLMIVIIQNSRRPGTQKHLAIAQNILRRKKRNHHVVSSFPFSSLDRKMLRSAEFIITIGGDGTILSAISYSEVRERPILPIHSGTLGFISSVKGNQLRNVMMSYLNRAVSSSSRRGFKLEDRFYLEVRFQRKTYFAFNDAVLFKGGSGKLILIEVSINDMETVSFRSDGLILSTATGSTAYNLSSSGPILHPGIPAIIFNPICPHSLTLSPIVIPGSDVIEVRASHPDSGAPVDLILDGGVVSKKIPAKEAVKITLAKEVVRFIKPGNEHYYTVLKEKMHWGI